MNLHDRLASSTGFDWNAGNADKNQEKHGVSPSEAEQLFFNVPLVAASDSDHSQQEPRFYALGRTDAGRPLFTAFTLRNGLIRVTPFAT